MDTDFLDKLSIFLKVTSGTFNLKKAVEVESHLEKYRNYKVMGYSAFLLKRVASKNLSIQKLSHKFKQY